MWEGAKIIIKEKYCTLITIKCVFNGTVEQKRPGQMERQQNAFYCPGPSDASVLLHRVTALLANPIPALLCFLLVPWCIETQ